MAEMKLHRNTTTLLNDVSDTTGCQALNQDPDFHKDDQSPAHADRLFRHRCDEKKHPLSTYCPPPPLTCTCVCLCAFVHMTAWYAAWAD